jgi:hypothetical protein
MMNFDELRGSYMSNKLRTGKFADEGIAEVKYD